MLSNDTVDGYMDPPVNSVTLLHPLFLPRLYPPLFTLYALQTEKTDAVYTEKLHYLNKRGDMALLSFLGVKRYEIDLCSIYLCSTIERKLRISWPSYLVYLKME